MSDMQLMLALFVGSGLLLIGLSIPMIRGRVKPNWIYGFRVPKTVNDPDVWYQANAYAGKWLLFTGVVTLAAALGLYLLPGLTVDSYALLCAAASLGALAVTVVMSFRYLKTIG